MLPASVDAHFPALATGAGDPPAGTGGPSGLIPSGGFDVPVFARASEAVGLTGATAGLADCILLPGFDVLVFARASRAVGLPAGTAGLRGLILPPGFDALVPARASGSVGLPAGTIVSHFSSNSSAGATQARA